MRVVVVDDDDDIRVLLRLSLPLDGIEVVGEASDGWSGLAEVSRVEPDGVVLDLRMPEFDGWEALEELHQAYPSTRVVVFTDDLGAVSKRAAQLGAAAVVHKTEGRAGLVRALLDDPA